MEQIDEVQVNSQALIDWVIYSLSLGMMQNLLKDVHREGTEQKHTSIEPNVEQSRARPEYLEQVNTNQACQTHAKHALPLEELFTGGIVSNQTETSHGEPCDEKSIIDDWHGAHVDQWNHGEGHGTHETCPQSVLENWASLVVDRHGTNQESDRSEQKNPWIHVCESGISQQLD